MFTGLIQESVIIREIIKSQTLTIIVEYQNNLIAIEEGDSISINGVCSTVTNLNKKKKTFAIDYSEETIKKTTIRNWKINDHLNSETCLTPSTKIGGHWIYGHVDTTAEMEIIKNKESFYILKLNYDEKYDVFMVSKGSIAINGMSLTIVDPSKGQCFCHIIPHTFKNTNLKTTESKSMVNIEFDFIGKYLYHFYTLRNKP